MRGSSELPDQPSSGQGAAGGVSVKGESPAETPPPPEGRPPFANRGVVTSETAIRSRERGYYWGQGVGDLIWKPGVDFLTASVPEAVGSLLLDETKPEEEGTARQGFGASERRLCLGGSCWRRWEPHQPSKAWGLAYESWEWDGEQAGGAASLLRGRECRPSRVDIAFDFSCEEKVRACDIVGRWRGDVNAAKTETGYVIGASGDEPWLTRYVGAKTSERRLRIYRKDVQDPFLLGERTPPILRVEVILRDRYAREWWGVWERDQDEAIRAAAAHVEAMTGTQIIAGELDLPEREPDEVRDVSQRTFQWIEQNHSIVAAMEEAGILGDVVELCRHRSASASRMTGSRMTKRVEAIVRAGPTLVVHAVRRMLGVGGDPVNDARVRSREVLGEMQA